MALAETLAAEHEVVVIDHEPDVADVFESLDVQFVPGSATSAAVLARANVRGADVLVASTGLDEVNIVACALASRLGLPETICFVSRDDFLDAPSARAGSPPSASNVSSGPRPSSPRTSNASFRPGRARRREFADGAIGSSSTGWMPRLRCRGTASRTLHLPHGALIVAVRRGDDVLHSAR